MYKDFYINSNINGYIANDNNNNINIINANIDANIYHFYRYDIDNNKTEQQINKKQKIRKRKKPTIATKMYDDRYDVLTEQDLFSLCRFVQSV